MRTFENVAKLIKEKRMSHPKAYSQSELSNLLGYKNGQFISNVERALCSVPLKMLGRVSEVLDISLDEVKLAVMKDYENTLEFYMNGTSPDSDDASSLGQGEKTQIMGLKGAPAFL